ncbi:MAG: hypothetical protein U0572_15255 [Phycisphaerales bacterium]
MNRILPIAISLWALAAIVAWSLPVVAWRRRGPRGAAVALLAPVGALFVATVFPAAYAVLEGTASLGSSGLWLGCVVALVGCGLATIGVRAALRPAPPPGLCPRCGHDCRGLARCPECAHVQ